MEIDKLVDRVIRTVAEVHDGTAPKTGLWAHLRRDPGAFQREVRRVLMGNDSPDFGWALDMLREGRKVRRPGWKDKGMWLVLVKAEDWNNDVAREWGGDLGGDCLPWIGLRISAWGSFGPWVPTPTDMLAVDWEIVE